MLLLYLLSTFRRLSRMAARRPCTHVTISLDDSYTYFYAFSRLRVRTPPISKYIEEKRVYYASGEDVPAQTKIFRMPMVEEGYARAVAYMGEVKWDGEIIYNLLSILLIPVFGGCPVYRASHCGEFIAKVLEQAGVELKRSYYRYTPELLVKLPGEYEVFEGVLENDSSEGMEDDFFRETLYGEYLGGAYYIIRELLYRQMFHKASPGFRPKAVRLMVEDGKL